MPIFEHLTPIKLAVTCKRCDASLTWKIHPWTRARTRQRLKVAALRWWREHSERCTNHENGRSER